MMIAALIALEHSLRPLRLEPPSIYPSRVVLRLRRSKTSSVPELVIEGARIRVGRIRPRSHRLVVEDGRLFSWGIRATPARACFPTAHPDTRSGR